MVIILKACVRLYLLCSSLAMGFAKIITLMGTKLPGFRSTIKFLKPFIQLFTKTITNAESFFCLYMLLLISRIIIKKIKNI